MTTILLVRKNKYNNKFSSADKTFEDSYGIRELLEIFPDSFILVTNDDTDFKNERIFNRKDLREKFGFNNKDEIKCEHCNIRNSADRQYCRRCGYENTYYSITKYLVSGFEKSAQALDYITVGFWQETDAELH